MQRAGADIVGGVAGYVNGTVKTATAAAVSVAVE